MLRAARATVVADTSLGAAIDRAIDLGRRGAPAEEAAAALGNTGFRRPHRAARGVRLRVPRHVSARGARGDDRARRRHGLDRRDRRGLDGLLGTAALPAPLLGAIQDGAFGPSHLRRLAAARARVSAGEPGAPARSSAAAALVRNLCLYPVILARGLRRLWSL